MSTNRLSDDEEEGLELTSPDLDGDERGERIVEEADLSWGALRQTHKEHFCYRKRRSIALWGFAIAMIVLIVILISIAVAVIEEHGTLVLKFVRLVSLLILETR